MIREVKIVLATRASLVVYFHVGSTRASELYVESQNICEHERYTSVYVSDASLALID